VKKNQNVDRGQSVVIVIKDRFLPNAPSAKVDKYAQWFNTPLPGRLSDVFGLKVNGFYETPEGVSFRVGQQQEAALVACSDVIGTFMRERLSAIASSMNEPAVLLKGP
jgi:hypothetical protein